MIRSRRTLTFPFPFKRPFSRSFSTTTPRRNRNGCGCGNGTHLTYPNLTLPLNTTTPLSSTGPQSLWRHIILATGPHTQDTWSHNPTKDDPSSIPGLLDKMQKERPDAKQKKIMIGLATLPKSEEPGVERLWVFPEGVCVEVSSADLGRGGVEVWRRLLESSEELEEMYGEGEEGGVILICGHTARDPRCALAGPVLLSQFLSLSPASSLPKGWQIALTTHVGGHAYAGNVIVYSRKTPKRGVWYGRVTPCDVEEIVARTVRGGEVVERLLRGVVEVES